MDAKETFRFKRFAVEQSRSAGMKVGTDGVLLGAWCRLDAPNSSDPAGETRLLDIGTGTGVIALMLAQRAPDARIDALDIDVECCAQAARNASASPWSGRIAVIHSPVQEYAAQYAAVYDHIVSNPPYFTESLLPPSPGRTAARHTLSLPHDELLRAVAVLLRPRGLFSVILPVEPALAMEAAAPAHGLRLTRADELCTREGTSPKRLLMEFVHLAEDKPVPQPIRGRVTIHEPGGDFTGQYRALTADFYLKF